MHDQPIDRIMTTTVLVIAPDAPIDEARELMASNGLHHLPVVADGKLVGMISASGTMARAAGGAPGSKPLVVGDIMRRNPVVLDRNSTLHDAAMLLASGEYHSLPVTDANAAVVGIVTTTDLLVVLLRQIPRSATAGGQPSEESRLRDLEIVRQAADIYLKSGEGQHEHAVLVRALERARQHLGPGVRLGRL